MSEPRILGMQFVCEVPPQLGQPTKLLVRRGRVVCETESGVPLIVPQPAEEPTPDAA